MRRIFLLLSLMAASSVQAGVEGSLVFDNIPESHLESADRLDAYLSARQAIPLGWSPQGRLLILTRFGETEQLHEVERPLGARRQLTFLRSPVAGGAFTPDPARHAFFYLADIAGAGHAQLYYQRIGEATARRLTDGKSANGAPLWSNSGREIAFFSTARDGASHDIDVVEPESGALAHLALTGDASDWRALDWSADDRKLLVSRSVSPAETSLYVVELSSGQRREIDAAASKAGIFAAKFSRDGQGVYLISNRDGEYAKLWYVNLFTGARSDISGRIAGDIEEFALSRDGHYLAYVSNEGGGGKLNVVDLRTHQDLIAPRAGSPGIMESLSFDADGKRLAFGFAPANRPEDAYVLDLGSNRLEAWTASEPGPVDPDTFVVPRLAQVSTFDRPRQMPVYVYEPGTPGPHPVLIVLHAGPAGQFRPRFDPWIEYVVNELGFAVVAPNVRGSSGYGKSYAALDDGMLREDAVKDVGALLVWVDLQSDFDAKRVVVSGTAYGGYLALAALVNYGERLRGAVDFAGMTDFIGFLADAPGSVQVERRAEYGDERNPETRAYLRRISPLTNADRITRPLLIVHGRNDPRVPIGQSEQLVNRLRSRGASVWSLQARDEGHAFERQEDRAAYYRTFAEFLTTLR